MKKLLRWVGVLMILTGCKPAMINFNEEQLDSDYIRKMIITAEGFRTNGSDTNNNEIENADTAFVKTSIYKTELKDRYITRDGIAEETVVNSRSPNPSPGLVMKQNSYRIYIVTAKNDSARAAILMPAIFNADGDCIGLGPAWIGTWGASQLSFYKLIRWRPKSKNNDFKWKYKPKENEYKRSKSIYFPGDGSRTKNEIIVIINEKRNIIDLYEFHIDKIYNAAENKFGGHKALRYDINEIFGDSLALNFRFMKDL